MREIIHIQAGECGNQIGSKFWESISNEHCIDSSGLYYGQSDLHLERINVYYNEMSKGRYFPRAVLVDPESNVTNAIRNDPFGELFSVDNIITGRSGCCKHWGYGYYNEGAEMLDDVLNVIRKEIERCDCLQGFQMTHALGGGTGSGFGSLLIDKLREEFPDRIITSFSSFALPEVYEHLIEPYNITLAMNHLIENVDVTYCFDNEALYKICSRQRLSPTYNDLNHLISASMSGITTCLRFPDQIHNDLRKTVVNMIPYPRLHLLISSLAPTFSHSSTRNNSLTLCELTEQMFDDKNMLVCCDPRQGQYLAVTTIFRGKMSMKEIDEHLDYLQTKDVSHLKHIKTTLCKVPARECEVSSTLVGNNTAIQQVLKCLLEKFSTMFCRKLYIYGYLRSCMDEMEFVEAECTLRDLIDEYEQIQSGKIEHE